MFDDDGYAKYCRRHTGITIVQNGIELDNRFVVPYNPTFLLRYQAHINIEFYNQSRSIKYLFKYVSKGHDRVTTAICSEDNASVGNKCTNEIKQYYDCRYISPFVNGAYVKLDVLAPDLGELHYLCVLLTFVKDPTSFEDIQTINGVLHPTYKDVCYALGLLDDDKEYIDGITKASRWSSDDILIKERHRLCNPGTLLYTLLDDERIKDISLAEIETMLRTNGRSLRDFHPMPLSSHSLLSNMDNMLMSEELNYGSALLRVEHSTIFASLTPKQSNIYNMIIDTINHKHSGVFFVNGFGGSKKIFIWNTVTSALRGRGDIVLAVASSGIASQLIPGGRTTHSKFAISLDCNENSTCSIMQGSDLANLLKHTKLIIWDEAQKTHRYCFEALDKTLRDICGKDDPDCHKKPFGGKVVFDGDFRQIFPVIPRGSRQDIALSSLNSSYIWDACKVLTLTKNMWLGTSANESENQAISEFVDWILKIGDGEVGEIINDEEKEITIPGDILLNNVIDHI
ncbi:uncharacterized protein G2W53_010126 [Senna tora]|uniref:ATP-dependent DNA helicase n=1 Tax=Senna tora TaxID=362788 RepID=A0A834WZ32_9FABA|nr:uncharacterized protein G2W53_010126 [Senna tora]